MNTASRKAKGRTLQNEIRDILFEYFPQLKEGDIKSAIMGESGRDINLSPKAEQTIPWDIEAKNTEKLNIWGALEQARANTKENRIPLLIFRRNRSKTYCVLEFEKLLKLLWESDLMRDTGKLLGGLIKNDSSDQDEN